MFKRILLVAVVAEVFLSVGLAAFRVAGFISSKSFRASLLRTLVMVAACTVVALVITAIVKSGRKKLEDAGGLAEPNVVTQRMFGQIAPPESPTAEAVETPAPQEDTSTGAPAPSASAEPVPPAEVAATAESAAGPAHPAWLSNAMIGALFLLVFVLVFFLVFWFLTRTAR